MADFAIPSTMFSHTSQAPVGHRSLMSFDETDGGNHEDQYVYTPASLAMDFAFSPWLLEESSAGPLTRSSSFSGSDYTTTPPYLDHPSSYHSVSLAQSLAPSFVGGNSPYLDVSQRHWSQSFTGPEAYGSQPPLSMWYGGEYEGGQPLPSGEHNSQSYQANETFSFPQSSLDASAARQNSGSAPFKLSNPASSTSSDSGSEDGASESEDGGSSYSRREASRTNSTSKTQKSAAVPVLNLGKWSMSVNSITPSEQRNYVCLYHPPGASGRLCNGRFGRPEHLRRHIKTVHSTARHFSCKVPGCRRAFSRGDNLRDHYWSHLEKGGRAGKNEKMSLEELRSILGSKEKKLAKKLKQKLVTPQKKLRSKL